MQYVWKSLWDSPLIARYSFYFHKKFNRAHSDLHFVVNRRKNTCLGTKTYFLYQRMTLEILKCFAYESSTYRDNFPGRLIIQWKLLLLLLELTCLDLVFMVILTWKIVLNTHSTAFIWKLYWKSNIYNIINVLNVLLPRTYVKYKLAGHNYS